MTIQHSAGPLVSFGQTTQGPTPDYNPDIGTSLFYAGSGLLDQRGYYAYQPGNRWMRGWLGATDIFTLNFTPNALATGNLANLVAPTTGVALALTAGAGVTPAASVLNASTQAAVGSLLLLDAVTAQVVASITASVLTVASVTNGLLTIGSVLSAATATQYTTIIGFGTGNGGTGTYIVSPSQTVSSQVAMSANAGINGVPIIPTNTNVLSPPQQGTLVGTSGPQLYNPLCMLGRNVRVTTQSGDTAVYTVRGFDIYGFPLTEAITANGASTVSGKKAFKYVTSVTPVGTVGAGASVGTGDVFGFPLFSLSFQDVYLAWGTTGNSGLVTATTGYLAGVSTDPATSTTGDTRGTYNVQSASNGTNRLTVWQNPPPTSIITTTGTYGVTQA
jgi:hypothetical protein